MGAHGHDEHAHDDHAHDAHDAHAHDDFDPEPARELSAGEPHTPSWVPLLGACLFLVGGVYFFATRADAGAPTAPSASASAAAAPAPRPPAERGRAASSSASGAARQMPPQTPEERQKMIDQIRSRMQGQPVGTGQPGPRPQPPRAP